jgi:hypothetical protein
MRFAEWLDDRGESWAKSGSRWPGCVLVLLRFSSNTGPQLRFTRMSTVQCTVGFAAVGRFVAATSRRPS